MNTSFKRLTALLLVIGMLGVCAPSMAEESVAGLNGITWVGEALASGKTLQSTETFIVDEASLSMLMGMLLGGGDEATIEQNMQIVNAILALIKNVSARSTICMNPMAGKVELLMQEGLIASADITMQEENLYLLTNLLPQYLFTVNGEEMNSVLNQLQTATMASGMGNPEISQETMTAFQAALGELMATPGVIAVTEGTFEENGIVYTSETTVNITYSVKTEFAADIIDIIAQDEGLMDFLYNISLMSNNSRTLETLTYDEFAAGLPAIAAEGHAEAAAVTNDYIAISVIVKNNEAENTLVDVIVSDEAAVQTVVKVTVINDTVSVLAGNSDSYIAFDGTFSIGQANTDINVLLTAMQYTDGITMIQSPATAVTDLSKAVKIGFTLSAAAANETENADYALTMSDDTMSLRIFGETNTTRSPLTVDSTIYIDLSGMLGLPEKAIGLHTVTCEADPLPAPKTEGMNQINMLAMGETEIAALGEAFNDVGMNTLLTNLMTYMPEEASPLLMMYLTTMQQ